MEENEVGCSVCQEPYDERRRPPRNLGCGHSVCTSCIEQIIVRGRRCPECRTPFATNSASSLPINYPLLRLARVLATRESTISPPTTPTENYNDAGECAAHVARLSQRCMTCRVWVCQECILVDHNLPPKGECKVLPLRKALGLMKTADAEPVNTMCRDLQQLRLGLLGQATQLEAVKKTHESTATCLRSVLSAEQDVVQEFETRRKGVMDRVAEVDGWVSGLRQAEAAINAAGTVRQLATAKLGARDCITSTEVKVKRERQRQAPSNVPHSLAGPQEVRGLLRLVSNMAVVQEGDGEEGRRWGRLSLHHTHLHLHALHKNTPKPSASTPVFTFSGVRGMVPRKDASAFLQLRWGGQYQGRVIVKMHGSTQRAKQFLMLCSGETGPSYINTRIFQAERIGGEGAIIRGGDYENNDGTAGAGIVEGVTEGGEYMKDAAPGLLVGAHSSQRHRLAVFGIILSPWPRHKTDTAFGEVTQGLATLLEAARCESITDVEVEDCGLIIPLTN